LRTHGKHGFVQPNAGEVFVAMWNLINGATSGFRRPRRTFAGSLPALLVGAGVGIAAWEIVRRRNPGAVDRIADSVAQTHQAVMDAID
jgi:hypothetical protein